MGGHVDRWRLILLGGIAALGSLAIQIIIPALPLLVDGIGASAADGQLIIAVYLIGLALGQLVWAPVADHHGRRPILLISIALFLIGSFICALADQLSVMLIGRLVQSMGASASLVTARAMATDNVPAGTTAAPLAILSSVTLISPAVAPLLGGGLTGLLGWRPLFWVMFALSGLSLILALRFLRETRVGDHIPLRPARFARLYWTIARTPGYLPLALSNGVMTGGFYVFLAVSPFLLTAAGATPAQAGLFYSATASSIIAGTLTLPPLIRRWPHLVRPISFTALALGGVGMIGVGLTGAHLIALLIVMSVISFGAGITSPALLAEAMDSQRDQASGASSLFTMIQMGGAALISTLIVRAAPSPGAELVLIGGLVLSALALRIWNYRRIAARIAT